MPTEEKKLKTARIWEGVKKMINNIASNTSMNLSYPPQKYPGLIVKSGSDKVHKKIVDFINTELEHMPIEVDDQHKKHGQLRLSFKEAEIENFLITTKDEDLDMSPKVDEKYLGLPSFKALLKECGARSSKHYGNLSYDAGSQTLTIYHLKGQSTDHIISLLSTLNIDADFGKTETAIKVVIDPSKNYMDFYYVGIDQFFSKEYKKPEVQSPAIEDENLEKAVTIDQLVDSVGVFYSQLSPEQKELFQKKFLPDSIVDIEALRKEIQNEERNRITNTVSQHLQNGYAIIDTNKPVVVTKSPSGELQLETVPVDKILS